VTNFIALEASTLNFLSTIAVVVITYYTSLIRLATTAELMVNYQRLFYSEKLIAAERCFLCSLWIYFLLKLDLNKEKLNTINGELEACFIFYFLIMLSIY
jgi:hypothetical protein